MLLGGSDSREESRRREKRGTEKGEKVKCACVGRHRGGAKTFSKD